MKSNWWKAIASFLLVLFTMPLGHALMMIMEKTMTPEALHYSAFFMRLVGLLIVIAGVFVKGDTKQLVGLITRSDLIVNPDEEQIAILMSTDLVTASPDDDVKDVAKKMIDNNVRRVPVVDDNGDLVGIITSFDLVSNALIKLESDDPVENFMITTVPTTWYKTPLNVAFETMKQFGLKSVLALNDSAKLVGILTETDFIEESEIVSERSEHSSTVGT